MLLILRLVFFFLIKLKLALLRKINYTRMEKSIINSVTLPRN